MEYTEGPRPVENREDFQSVVSNLKNLAAQIEKMTVPELQGLRDALNNQLNNNEVSELRGLALLLRNLDAEL